MRSTRQVPLALGMFGAPYLFNGQLRVFADGFSSFLLLGVCLFSVGEGYVVFERVSLSATWVRYVCRHRHGKGGSVLSRATFFVSFVEARVFFSVRARVLGWVRLPTFCASCDWKKRVELFGSRLGWPHLGLVSTQFFALMSTGSFI